MIQTRKARSSSDILAQMVRIVREHATDAAPWASWTLPEVFEAVKRGGYNREPASWRSQVLARPALVVGKRVPVVACANKAIILASWAHLRGIPWRLVAVGRVHGRPPHHVFPEMLIGGEWLPVDATYSWSVLFAQKPYAVRLVLEGNVP
jgi:hypothetical protein